MPHRLMDSLTEVSVGAEVVTFDVEGLIHRLLLFDSVILVSNQLKEIGPLVNAFGADGVGQLLESGALRIYCHSGQVGSVNTPGTPSLTFSFAKFREADRREYLHQRFQEVHKVDGLTIKSVAKLKRQIAARLVDPVLAEVDLAFDQFLCELDTNGSMIRTALKIATNRALGQRPETSSASIRIHKTGASNIRVETSLCEAGVPEETAHQIVLTALLAVAGANQQLSRMKHYGALVALWDRDLPVVGEKLRFLAHELGPDRAIQDVGRVLRLQGLPSMDAALADGRVDVERLLVVRESDECRLFRQWVSEGLPGDLTDVQARLDSFTSKLAGWSQSIPGKSFRFLVSTGAGMIPGSGLAAGAVTGLLDTFVLDRVLRTTGPFLFLSRTYPSIFK